MKSVRPPPRVIPPGPPAYLFEKPSKSPRPEPSLDYPNLHERNSREMDGETEWKNSVGANRDNSNKMMSKLSVQSPRLESEIDFEKDVAMQMKMIEDSLQSMIRDDPSLLSPTRLSPRGMDDDFPSHKLMENPPPRRHPGTYQNVERNADLPNRWEQQTDNRKVENAFIIPDRRRNSPSKKLGAMAHLYDDDDALRKKLEKQVQYSQQLQQQMKDKSSPSRKPVESNLTRNQPNDYRRLPPQQIPSDRSGLKVGLEIDEEKALEKAKQLEYRRQLDRQLGEPVAYNLDRDYQRKQDLPREHNYRIRDDQRSGLKIGLDIEEEKAMLRAKQYQYKQDLDRQGANPANNKPRDIEFDQPREYVNPNRRNNSSAMENEARGGLKIGLDLDEEKALKKAKQMEYQRQLDQQTAAQPRPDRFPSRNRRQAEDVSMSSNAGINRAASNLAPPQNYSFDNQRKPERAPQRTDFNRLPDNQYLQQDDDYSDDRYEKNIEKERALQAPQKAEYERYLWEKRMREAREEENTRREIERLERAQLEDINRLAQLEEEERLRMRNRNEDRMPMPKQDNIRSRYEENPYPLEKRREPVAEQPQTFGFGSSPEDDKRKKRLEQERYRRELEQQQQEKEMRKKAEKEKDEMLERKAIAAVEGTPAAAANQPPKLSENISSPDKLTLEARYDKADKISHAAKDKLFEPRNQAPDSQFDNNKKPSRVNEEFEDLGSVRRSRDDYRDKYELPDERDGDIDDFRRHAPPPRVVPKGYDDGPTLEIDVPPKKQDHSDYSHARIHSPQKSPVARQQLVSDIYGKTNVLGDDSRPTAGWMPSGKNKTDRQKASIAEQRAALDKQKEDNERRKREEAEKEREREANIRKRQDQENENQKAAKQADKDKQRKLYEDRLRDEEIRRTKSEKDIVPEKGRRTNNDRQHDDYSVGSNDNHHYPPKEPNRDNYSAPPLRQSNDNDYRERNYGDSKYRQHADRDDDSYSLRSSRDDPYGRAPPRLQSVPEDSDILSNASQNKYKRRVEPDPMEMSLVSHSRLVDIDPYQVDGLLARVLPVGSQRESYSDLYYQHHDKPKQRYQRSSEEEPSMTAMSSLLYMDRMTPAESTRPANRSKPESAKKPNVDEMQPPPKSTIQSASNSARNRREDVASAAEEPELISVPSNRYGDNIMSTKESTKSVADYSHMHEDASMRWRPRNANDTANRNMDPADMPAAGKPTQETTIEVKRKVYNNIIPTADEVPDNRIFVNKDKREKSAPSSRNKPQMPDANLGSLQSRPKSSGAHGKVDDFYEQPNFGVESNATYIRTDVDLASAITDSRDKRKKWDTSEARRDETLRQLSSHQSNVNTTKPTSGGRRQATVDMSDDYET